MLHTRDVKSREFFFLIRDFFPGLDENSRPRDDDITPVTAFNVKKGVSEKLCIRALHVYTKTTYIYRRAKFKVKVCVITFYVRNLFANLS